MPFIVGCGRSGNTLLRMMLDSHPDMAIPPETEVIVHAMEPGLTVDAFCDTVTGHWRFVDLHIDQAEWRARVGSLGPFSAADGLREMYRMYADKFSKTRVGDKTPFYAQHLALIARTFPEARAIHMIRDGRDVAASMMPLWFSPGDAGAVAEHWCSVVSSIRRSGELLPMLEVRYEELVTNPERQMRQVLEFCELDWSDEVLRFHERAGERIREVTEDAQTTDGTWLAPVSRRHEIHQLLEEPPNPARIGAFRTALSPTDIAVFEDRAGWLLDELAMR